MKKTLALLMALTLMVTAIGVLTVAADKTEGEVATVEGDEVTVNPEAFDGDDKGGDLEGGMMEDVDSSDEVIVDIDPIHVS